MVGFEFALFFHMDQSPWVQKTYTFIMHMSSYLQEYFDKTKIVDPLKVLKESVLSWLIVLGCDAGSIGLNIMLKLHIVVT